MSLPCHPRYSDVPSDRGTASEAISEQRRGHTSRTPGGSMSVLTHHFASTALILHSLLCIHPASHQSVRGSGSPVRGSSVERPWVGCSALSNSELGSRSYQTAGSRVVLKIHRGRTGLKPTLCACVRATCATPSAATSLRTHGAQLCDTSSRPEVMVRLILPRDHTVPDRSR